MRRTLSKPRAESSFAVASALRRTSDAGKPGNEMLGMRTSSQRSLMYFLRLRSNSPSAAVTRGARPSEFVCEDMALHVTHPSDGGNVINLKENADAARYLAKCR